MLVVKDLWRVVLRKKELRSFHSFTPTSARCDDRQFENNRRQSRAPTRLEDAHARRRNLRGNQFYGAFVLNRRVVLNVIDATLARWRGDAGSSPLDGARTAALDALVNFHTGGHVAPALVRLEPP